MARKPVTRACFACGTWTCAACGWRRYRANMNPAVVQGCTRCGSAEGTMVPSRHAEYTWWTHNEDPREQIPDWQRQAMAAAGITVPEPEPRAYSACCGWPVIVVGGVTQHWECMNCGKPCDVTRYVMNEEEADA